MDLVFIRWVCYLGSVKAPVVLECLALQSICSLRYPTYWVPVVSDKNKFNIEA